MFQKLRWYIVRRPYDDIARRYPAYAGLEGFGHPLDDIGIKGTKWQGKCWKIQHEFEHAHDFVTVDGEELWVCTNLDAALRYKREVDLRFNDCWLLEVGLGSTWDETDQCDGYDYGPMGGEYSAIYSEILQGVCPGPPLNKWYLFFTVEDAESYVRVRESCETELEDSEGFRIVGIRVLESPVAPPGERPRTLKEGNPGIPNR